MNLPTKSQTRRTQNAQSHHVAASWRKTLLVFECKKDVLTVGGTWNIGAWSEKATVRKGDENIEKFIQFERSSRKRSIISVGDFLRNMKGEKEEEKIEAAKKPDLF